MILTTFRHRLKHLGSVCGAALVAVSFAVTASAQDTNGDPIGFRFLTIGGGARAVGLAETMVADGQDDPFVMEYNPAGLAALTRTTVSFSHNQFYQDTRGEYITAGVPIGQWSLGGRVGYLGTDNIPLRTGPSTQPLAFYDATSGVFQAALARQIDPSLSLGISAGYVLEHINTETAQSAILGIGLRFQRWPGVVIGASLVNFGPKAEFVNQQVRMPNRFLLGGTWTHHIVTVRAELVAPDNDNAKGLFAAEATPDPRLSLRAGIKLGYDTQFFAAGFGARTPDGRIGVDYAFAPYSDDFGSTHRFGLSLRP